MTYWSANLSQAEVELDRQARKDHRSLLAHELFWRDHQVWLAEKGYMLRPRYRPGWQPSWEEGDRDAWMRQEDGPAAPVCRSNVNITDSTSQTIARLYSRRNPSVQWRDCYPQEILSYQRPI